MPALPGYYTTKEAAEKLGYKSSDSIKQYCLSGKITGALKVGRIWLVPESWIIEEADTVPNPKGNRGLTRDGKNK